MASKKNTGVKPAFKPLAEEISNVVSITPAKAGGNGGPTLEEEIKEWGRAAQAVQDDFHPLAIKVLERVMETRNATIALQLQNAMPKILRKREFAAWLATYSPIKLSQEGKETSDFAKCELRPETGDKLYRPFDIEGAKANPFFMKKEEVKALDPGKMDIAKMILTQITSLANSMLGGEKAKPLADGTSIGEAKSKLAQLNKSYNMLHNGKMVDAMPGKTQQLVKDALAKEAA